MTITEFNLLSQSQRSDILWEWAFFIARKKEKDVTLVLFSLREFFIEVIISPDNKAERITAISKNAFLVKYSGIVSGLNNPILKFSFPLELIRQG